MIHHHPDGDMLLSYASGSADEATGLIVATHMHFCAACRTQAQELEAVGGSLLQLLTPAPLEDDALESVLARLEEIKPHQPPHRNLSIDGTPSVLRHYIGGDLSSVRWRQIGSRLAYAPLFRRGAVSARLLRGVPGAESGPHSHRGMEYTLVLKGGFSDVTGTYGTGDLQVMAADQHHNPIADPGEDCINLAVTTGPLKFDSLLQKIVAPLFGF